MSDPGDVLYHDADGVLVGLDGVVNDGLGRDHRTRYPRAGHGRFDGASQAAFLLAALAGIDDAAAAAAAEVLMADHPGHDRALREVALSMGAGAGPGSRTVLERLTAWPSGPVRSEAREWLTRRGDR